jgi:hypothetical protein
LLLPTPFRSLSSGGKGTAAKRRIDPEVMKLREERSRKKLNSRIRELMRMPKKLKPLDELTIDTRVVDKLKYVLFLIIIYFLLLFSERIRAPVQLSEEEIDRRALLFKEYAKYRNAEDIEVCLFIYYLFIYY